MKECGHKCAITCSSDINRCTLSLSSIIGCNSSSVSPVALTCSIVHATRNQLFLDQVLDYDNKKVEEHGGFLGDQFQGSPAGGEV